MEILEVKYAKRFNLGDYQHEEYTVVAEVEEGESADTVLATIKELVHRNQAGKSSVVEPSLAAPVAEEAPAPKKGKGRPPGAKNKPKAVEEVPAEVVAEVEEHEAKEEAKEEEEKAPPQKKLKKVGEVYSRSSEIHKKIFAEILGDVYPMWKSTDAGKSKAKNASMKMEGVEFLDSEGEVLESFLAELEFNLK